MEAQRSKTRKFPSKEERNREITQWRQRQRNSGTENKVESGSKGEFGMFGKLGERGSARGSKGALNKEVMERRKGTGSRDEIVRKEVYGSKGGFGSRGGIGSRERVLSSDGTNEEFGSKEAFGSKEELGSREGIGSRERVGSKEGAGEELGSRDDIVSGDAIGIREVDSPEGSGIVRLYTSLSEGIIRDESERPNLILYQLPEPFSINIPFDTLEDKSVQPIFH
uniref:Uncharacterized protein n=1 Tax=Haemonchus contortus TaxID=6289 RepID=W6NUL5_HAECO